MGVPTPTSTGASRDRSARTPATTAARTAAPGRLPAAGRDGRARLLRQAADHDDDQPVRGPGREPGRHRGAAARPGRTEADEAQGRSDLLRRRVEEPPGVLV